MVSWESDGRHCAAGRHCTNGEGRRGECCAEAGSSEEERADVSAAGSQTERATDPRLETCSSPHYLCPGRCSRHRPYFTEPRTGSCLLPTMSSSSSPVTTTASTSSSPAASSDAGNNGGGSGSPPSSTLYLCVCPCVVHQSVMLTDFHFVLRAHSLTFLATLFVLLFVSCAIVLRSFIIRRRFRQQVEEQIAAGLLPPEAAYGLGKRDFGEKPKLWDVSVLPTPVAGGWPSLQVRALRPCPRLSPYPLHSPCPPNCSQKHQPATPRLHRTHRTRPHDGTASRACSPATARRRPTPTSPTSPTHRRRSMPAATCRSRCCSRCPHRTSRTPTSTSPRSSSGSRRYPCAHTRPGREPAIIARAPTNSLRPRPAHASPSHEYRTASHLLARNIHTYPTPC